jgi:hypothetical protein
MDHWMAGLSPYSEICVPGCMIEQLPFVRDVREYVQFCTHLQGKSVMFDICILRKKKYPPNIVVGAAKPSPLA